MGKKRKKNKKDYRDKLLSKGVPASYISEKYGKRISSREYKKIRKKWKHKKEKFYNSLPDELKNHPKFANSSYDQQVALKGMYDVNVSNNEDKARKMDQAYNKAVEQADPYWKQIIRIAQDETVRNFDEAKGDYQASADRIERRQIELGEDITLNKDRLSLSEQKQLGRINRSYTQQIKEVARSAADAGVTFGSGDLTRLGKEDVVTTEKDDIVESTKREFGQQIEDLTIRQQRGDADATTQLADLERTYGSRVQDIGRNIEKYLGSDAIDGLNLQGYDKLGDTTGSIYEDKVRDVETRKRTLFNELNQDSLNLNFL